MNGFWRKEIKEESRKVGRSDELVAEVQIFAWGRNHAHTGAELTPCVLKVCPTQAQLCKGPRATKGEGGGGFSEFPSWVTGSRGERGRQLARFFKS